MRTIATLRDIEFGKDPYTPCPTPPSIERLARDFGRALDGMRRTVGCLIAHPTAKVAIDAATAARDDLIFAEGALWDAMRKLPHRVFALEDGRFLFLSDTPAPARPHLILVNARGERPCPGCYGVGMSRAPFAAELAFMPCVVCHQAGLLKVELPACCRKDPSHVV